MEVGNMPNDEPAKLTLASSIAARNNGQPKLLNQVRNTSSNAPQFETNLGSLRQKSQDATEPESRGSYRFIVGVLCGFRLRQP